MMASGGYGTRRLCPDVLTKYILTLDTHILVDFLGSVEKKGPKCCVVTLADSAECSANQIREVARWRGGIDDSASLKEGETHGAGAALGKVFEMIKSSSRYYFYFEILFIRSIPCLIFLLLQNIQTQRFHIQAHACTRLAALQLNLPKLPPPTC
jgi:hypothetical protein